MQLASKEIGAAAASLPRRKGLELEASGDSFFFITERVLVSICCVLNVDDCSVLQYLGSCT